MEKVFEYRDIFVYKIKKINFIKLNDHGLLENEVAKKSYEIEKTHFRGLFEKYGYYCLGSNISDLFPNIVHARASEGKEAVRSGDTRSRPGGFLPWTLFGGLSSR